MLMLCVFCDNPGGWYKNYEDNAEEEQWKLTESYWMSSFSYIHPRFYNYVTYLIFLMKSICICSSSC